MNHPFDVLRGYDFIYYGYNSVLTHIVLFFFKCRTNKAYFVEYKSGSWQTPVEYAWTGSFFGSPKFIKTGADSCELYVSIMDASNDWKVVKYDWNGTTFTNPTDIVYSAGVDYLMTASDTAGCDAAGVHIDSNGRRYISYYENGTQNFGVAWSDDGTNWTLQYPFSFYAGFGVTAEMPIVGGDSASLPDVFVVNYFGNHSSTDRQGYFGYTKSSILVLDEIVIDNPGPGEIDTVPFFGDGDLQPHNIGAGHVVDDEASEGVFLIPHLIVD